MQPQDLPKSFLLSVIVPVFNEADSFLSVVESLRQTGLPLEIIVVNDGSDDGTKDALDSLQNSDDLIVIEHSQNRGKGFAIRTGIPMATGDVIVIQDADREYQPEDFCKLLSPLLRGEADIVFGNRFSAVENSRSGAFHRSGNRLISRCLSATIGQSLTDVETCYKMGLREHWLAIVDGLREERFGIEIELSAKWSHRGLNIVEIPIRYEPRWYDSGKKITWRDGISALRCIGKYGLLRR